MSIITVVGAGMMGSAMSFPARDNGHEVRLVGIHNRETIESIRSSGYHPTLKRQLPDGVKAFHLDGLAEDVGFAYRRGAFGVHFICADQGVKSASESWIFLMWCHNLNVFLIIFDSSR